MKFQLIFKNYLFPDIRAENTSQPQYEFWYQIQTIQRNQQSMSEYPNFVPEGQITPKESKMELLFLKKRGPKGNGQTQLSAKKEPIEKQLIQLRINTVYSDDNNVNNHTSPNLL